MADNQTNFKIALAQINPTVGDIEGNVAKIIEFAQRAKKEGAALTIFPEMAICGYPPADLLYKESFVQANLDGLEKLKKAIVDHAVLVGFVDINKGKGRPLFNACAYIQNGEIKAKQYKTLLPTYDVFDEDRYFEPAKNYEPCNLNDHIFGLSICEDIWNYEEVETSGRYHFDPVAKLAESKPMAIINISASPFSAGKNKLREKLICHHASKHGVPILFVNQVGGNDQLLFDGRSMVLDEKGKLIARATAFTEDLLIVEFDQKGKLLPGQIKEQPEGDAQEIYQALVLGTKDYLTKCGFKEAVIGLSGGIDSAVVCAIAVAALGKENVHGVAMPSPYSSTGAVEDAQVLAKNLDIKLQVIPIESGMKSFDSMLANSFKNAKPNVAEENIQARLRGAILMALSNKFHYLVLATGNKSELAVGYCTLYGDMCGGLAVISDVPKLMVYELAKLINTKAGYDLIPSSTIEKAPSAELRPNQTDQDTLPPYPVLDAIIHDYVELRMKTKDILKKGYDPHVVKSVIERIDHNEYKRKQAAPGLKVTKRAFGVGWRMPIAQRFHEV